MYRVVSGSDQCDDEINVLLSVSGSLKSSSLWSGLTREHAVDGDDSTGSHWSSDITEGVVGEWIAADLGAQYLLTNYRVKQGYSTVPEAEPEGATEIQIYGSNDAADWSALANDNQASFVAADWTLVETLSGTTTGSDTGQVTLPPSQRYRYLALYASAGPNPGDGDGWNVQEWELYSCPGGYSIIDAENNVVGTIDGSGIISSDDLNLDCPLSLVYTIEGSSAGYDIPTDAQYILDVWFDYLHTTRDLHWTFEAPRTINVLSPIMSGTQVRVAFVTEPISENS